MNYGRYAYPPPYLGLRYGVSTGAESIFDRTRPPPLPGVVSPDVPVLAPFPTVPRRPALPGTASRFVPVAPPPGLPTPPPTTTTTAPRPGGGTDAGDQKPTTTAPYPWYFWVGGTLLLAGGLYLGYKHLTKGSASDARDPRDARGPRLLARDLVRDPEGSREPPAGPPVTLGDYLAQTPSPTGRGM